MNVGVVVSRLRGECVPGAVSIMENAWIWKVGSDMRSALSSFDWCR